MTSLRHRQRKRKREREQKNDLQMRVCALLVLDTNNPCRFISNLVPEEVDLVSFLNFIELFGSELFMDILLLHFVPR